MDDDSDLCGMLKGSCSVSFLFDFFSGNISVVVFVFMLMGLFMVLGMLNRMRCFGVLG